MQTKQEPTHKLLHFHLSDCPTLVGKSAPYCVFDGVAFGLAIKWHRDRRDTLRCERQCTESHETSVIEKLRRVLKLIVQQIRSFGLEMEPASFRNELAVFICQIY